MKILVKIKYKFTRNLQTKKRIGVKNLKASGVTRKIDELGRIVIPKEIRRNLSIRDGENLEIFIDNEAICLKKHYQMHNFTDIRNKLCHILDSLIEANILITDRETIISANEKCLPLIGKEINEKIINLIDERESFFDQVSSSLTFDDVTLTGYFYMAPIISSMDSLGMVIINTPKPADYKLIVKLLARILAEKVDIC